MCVCVCVCVCVCERVDLSACPKYVHCIENYWNDLKQVWPNWTGLSIRSKVKQNSQTSQMTGAFRRLLGMVKWSYAVYITPCCRHMRHTHLRSDTHAALSHTHTSSPTPTHTNTHTELPIQQIVANNSVQTNNQVSTVARVFSFLALSLQLIPCFFPPYVYLQRLFCPALFALLTPRQFVKNVPPGFFPASLPPPPSFSLSPRRRNNFCN